LRKGTRRRKSAFDGLAAPDLFSGKENAPCKQSCLVVRSEKGPGENGYERILRFLKAIF
jgi:hypothetical protein